MNEVLDLVPTAEQPQALTVPPSNVVTPLQLLTMAVQQGADLDRLERLMALKKEWEADEARKAFHAAMAEFKRNPPTIFKNKHVAFATSKGTTEYDHATLGHVVRQVTSALAPHGLSAGWSIDRRDGGRIHVTCTVTHVLGHSQSVTLDCAPDDSGGKNNIQAAGSAITYLQRYTLLAILGLATDDMGDDDGRGAGGGAGGDDDGRRVTPPPPPPPAQHYDQAVFDANLGDWTKVIASGRKTADSLIAFIESRGKPLTEAQKATLRAIKKA